MADGIIGKAFGWGFRDAVTLERFSEKWNPVFR